MRRAQPHANLRATGTTAKAERKALIRSDVREVLVPGQVSMVAGRLTIHAESVQWNDKQK